MIAVIDYGLGNLHSVAKAIERLGYEAVVTADKDQLMRANAAILPGVGAFGDAVAYLQASGMDEGVRAYAASGKPLLGICLGMQLLFTEGEEHGCHPGLNLLPGRVVRFQGDYKIPHMGWNKLEFLRLSPIISGLEEGHVYFVHSYHVLAEEKRDLIAAADYYQPVSAIVGRNNVYGMQFHPEKSGQLGMGLLANFLRLSGREAQVSL